MVFDEEQVAILVLVEFCHVTFFAPKGDQPLETFPRGVAGAHTFFVNAGLIFRVLGQELAESFSSKCGFGALQQIE